MFLTNNVQIASVHLITHLSVWILDAHALPYR